MRVSYLISSLLTGILNLNWISILTSLLWWEMPGLDTFFFWIFEGIYLSQAGPPLSSNHTPVPSANKAPPWWEMSVSLLKQCVLDLRSRSREWRATKSQRNKKLKTARDLRGTVKNRWCWLSPGSATLIPDLPNLGLLAGNQPVFVSPQNAGKLFRIRVVGGSAAYSYLSPQDSRPLSHPAVDRYKTPPRLRQHPDSTHSRCFCVLLNLGQAAAVFVPLLSEHKATFF